MGDNPTLLPTVFVCSRYYATVVIMFYCFCFNKVPSKAFGIMLGDSWFDPAEKQKLLRSRKLFSFLTEECFWVDYFFRRLIDKFLTSKNLFHNFWSYRSIRELQITTNCSVLTDSVFYVLFAYFDESMGSIGGYEPWISWNTVDIT